MAEDHTHDSLNGPSASPRKFSEEVMKKRFRGTPIAFYRLKDKFVGITSSGSFLDAMLVVIAMLAVASAFGFYPLAVLAVICVLLFFFALFNPFLGLLLFTLAAFPVYMYQTPVLAWSFIAAATAMLIFGYMHYRVAIFTYILIALAFSPFGVLLEIPFFVLSVLTIGNKRAILTMALAILLIVPMSAISGIQNTGYISYNAQQAHSVLASTGSAQILSLDVPTKQGYSLANFGTGLSFTFSQFFSQPVTYQIGSVFGSIIQTWFINPMGYLIQMAVLAAAIFGIDLYATSSRSKFKGAVSSLIGIFYPLSYAALSSIGGASVNFLPFFSFAIAPAALYVLEYYDVNIVKALEVKKQDIRMRFGEAFEDLADNESAQTFDDIGNYEQTKKELREAVIAPIEERGISRAYNVRPTKGILFFGPPGTGKTMLMRALSSEIRGGFYYVKATNLISAVPGESERSISNLFSIAKKNAPCILFFDEVESIAMARDAPGIDDTHRHAMSQLLQEMDGFSKLKNVIVVGATNRPDLMDSAILRPGRFDKIIYVPLPDLEGRKKIFRKYLSRLPVSRNVNVNELASKTERYSGADIKAVCETVAQSVSQDAAEEHKVLEILQQDFLDMIKATKPSTSISQLDTYSRFKLDFERNTHKDIGQEDAKESIGMMDIIGNENAKKAIREAIELPLTHPELVKKYDIKTVNGLLLFGPPGNGKTMLMKAVNAEMKGVTMLSLNGADISEIGYDKGTALVRDVFNRAKENAPSVIFIDEVDAVLPKRQGASELMVQITSEVLKELDGIKSLSNVVVIGATNTPENLDPAILRPGRFDKLIFVKPPTASARAELFKKFLENVPHESGIDYAKLGKETPGFTGADIAGVCREAKTKALESEIDTGSESNVKMQSLESVIKEVKPSAPDSIVAQYEAFLNKYGQR